MRNRFFRTAALLGSITTLALLSNGAGAQTAPTNPATPAVPSPDNITKSNAAGVNYLVKRFKLSKEDAEQRLNLQKEVSALAYKLASENPDQFGGVFVEHQPVYKIVVLFKDAENRNAVRDSVSPQLRSYLQVQKAKRSEKEVRDAVSTLSAALKAGGIPAAVGFDTRNQKFVVTAADDTKVKAVSALIPADLAPDVLTRVGLLPHDAQAGYASGDYTYGGWTTYNSSGAPWCTTGYVVRMSDARYGVTTASHCNAGAPNPKIWVNGHYVTLAARAVVNDTGLYDFQVHPTGNLTVYGYVAFTNNQPIRGYESIVNSEYGYGDSGSFGIQDGLYRVYDYVGDIRCKQGQRTGLSCGEVVAVNTSYGAHYGLTQVGYPDTRVMAFQGDSGGPVFTVPASDGTIMPAGLVVGANGPSDSYGNPMPCDSNVYSDCAMFYMPIERINDQQPMQIKTMTGTLNP